MSTTQRDEVVRRLSQLLVDDPDTQAYVKAYLLEHKFERVPVEDDGVAYDIWYAETTETLRGLMRDVIDNLEHDPEEATT